MILPDRAQLEWFSHAVLLDCKHLIDQNASLIPTCNVCKKEWKLLDRPMLKYVFQVCLENDRPTYVIKVLEGQRELWEDLPQVAEVFNRVLGQMKVDAKELDLADLNSPTETRLPVSPPARPTNPHASYLEEEMKGNRRSSDRHWVVVSPPSRLSHHGPDPLDLKDYEEEDPVVAVARYLSSKDQ
jgi:hypothetical protein